VDEAAILHSGLMSAFEAVLPSFDPASTFERRRGHVIVTCPRLPLPQMNGVWLGGGDVLEVAEIERICQEVEGKGVPFWLQARQSLTIDVAAIVDELGFRLADSEAGMVVRRDELTAARSTSLRVERITEGDGLRTAMEVAAAGFETPTELMEPMYSADVLATPGVSVYLGRSEGQPVSTAVSYLANDTLGIFGVATPNSFRRRGFGTAITAHACDRGFIDGARLAWLQSSSLGEPVYRRLGFRRVETYLLYRS
jgi:hypothetical protein